ncbi:hypothetical protein [Paenibacillus sp. 1295]|uniref:hypothetical protein n=1 Tax=Paenibacillus sp. M2 TaxID=3341793 RepID=UPI001AE68D09
MPKRKVCNPILQQHSQSEQSRFSKLFATLHIGKALRNAGISKSFALSSLAIFQIVFFWFSKESTGFAFWKVTADPTCQEKMLSIDS